LYFKGEPMTEISTERLKEILETINPNIVNTINVKVVSHDGYHIDCYEIITPSREYQIITQDFDIEYGNFYTQELDEILADFENKTGIEVIYE